MEGIPWFWRAIIGSVTGAFAYLLIQGTSRVCTAAIYGWNIRDALMITVYSSLLLMPFLFTAVAAYSWVTRRFGPEPLPRQTQCRKCGYNLRGIREPRCPECGERI